MSDEQVRLTNDPSTVDGQLRRSADAVRAVIDALVAGDEDKVRAVVDDLEGIAAALEGPRRASKYEDGAARRDPNVLARHPIFGVLNPLAPPVALEVEGTAVRATGTYGVPYEGPPGCLHGGYIAATFDVVLAMAAAIGAQAGVTRSLTIEYLRTTPLHEPLIFEAEVTQADEIHVRVEGRLLAFEDVETARAVAVFSAARR
jgi:acyl-coenzyme A thioesterase PaaI-like protein